MVYGVLWLVHNNILKCCSCELSFWNFLHLLSAYFSVSLTLTFPLIKYTQPTCYVCMLFTNPLYFPNLFQSNSLVYSKITYHLLFSKFNFFRELSSSSKHILKLKESREDESIKINQWTKKPSITTFFLFM